MSRKLIIILCCCFLCATLVVVALYATTRTIIHQNNSFIREYAKMAAVKSSEADLGLNSWYIAGITDNRIFFANITNPFRLIITNHSLTDSQHVKLRLKGIEKPIVYKSTTVKIDSPHFYLADGTKPALYKGRLGEWEAERVPYDSGAYFTQLVPLARNTYAIRTNDATTLDNVLGKVQLDTPRILLKHGLLQKQVDGIFCTDGMLLYNNDLKRLVYTYYYRNEFIVCDTNFVLAYRGHTIDTFSHARIKVGYVNSENRKTLMSREYVNIRSCTSGNYLFMWSNVMAKNDVKGTLRQQSVIDVYDLRSNTYGFSFSLPNHTSSSPMREFKIFNNRLLIAMYDSYVVTYDLRAEVFL